MHRAIQLAALGVGKVSPNPLVGCVIVHPNFGIIGEGWHQQYGGPHAEVNAIASVENKELLKEATLYVTLEPCNHFGKTPPCSQLIVAMGIPKVVAALTDPNPLVAGKGFETLKKAGIEVEVGICESEAKIQNKYFLHRIATGLPYVHLKWAESADGYIAPPDGKPVQISDAVHQMQVHKQRSEVDAILVGYNTVVTDNPALTVRHWAGKNPQRVVLDKDLALPLTYQIFRGEEKIYLINTIKEGVEGNLHYLKIADFGTPFPMLKRLAEAGISSLVVEGGAKTLDWFLKHGAFQEKWVYRNPDVVFGGGSRVNYY